MSRRPGRIARAVGGLRALRALLQLQLEEQLEGQRQRLDRIDRSVEALLSDPARTGLASTFTGDYFDRPNRETAQAYWSRHNVTAHARFATAAESLEAFNLRNSLYPGYLDLMPVTGWAGKAVLDYGCGPGNDLVGFAVHSRPARMIGVDMAQPSLDEAARRLSLHGATAELVQVPYGTYDLPVESGSIDCVHCSGVLMLVEDPVRLLREFRRILKPDGVVQLMVYNYDSVWLHLYVAYVVQLENGLYAGRTVEEAFSRTTDGEDCPLVRVWRPADVAAMAADAGLDSQWRGAAAALWELHVLQKRYRAAMDPRLRAESRAFLLGLTIDGQGQPLHRGERAGIDGCYALRPRR